MNSSFLSSTRVFFPSFYIHNPSGASCRGASSLPLSFFMVGVVFGWHQTFNTISQMLHLNLIRPKKILSLYTVRVFHPDLRQMLVLMSFTVSFFFFTASQISDLWRSQAEVFYSSAITLSTFYGWLYDIHCLGHGLICLKNVNQCFWKPKMTSLVVMFCPQLRDIQFTVKGDSTLF